MKVYIPLPRLWVWWIAGLAIISGAAAATAQTEEAADSPPNILFLFADDQRPDAVGAFGNEHIRTPHIDRLTESGFRFTNAYCMGSTMGAVCRPSRAMVHSGRTLFRVPMDLEVVRTLGETLRAAGYTTFGTGKWHNNRPSFTRSFQHGEAVFFGGMSNHKKVPLRDLKPDGSYTDRRIGEKFSSTLFADAAVGFIESHGGSDQPFFAYVSFTAPHDPRMPPGEYAKMYDPGDIPLPANFLPQHPFFTGWMTGRDEQLAPWPRTPGVIRQQIAAYYGMISHMDHQIGRILDALEQTGQAENTVIVYAADHGLALGSHGLLGKQNLYEHSMGTPLIFTGPGIPDGESSDALVYLHDIYPTLCELAGAEVPEAVGGKNLASIWRGDTRKVRDTLFTAYEDVMRAVRGERWKLIRYPHINKTQLFDLRRDPHERYNLADDPRFQGRIKKMMGLLRDWQKRVGDEAPLTSKNPRSADVDLTGHPRTPDRHQPDWIVREYFSEQP